MSAFITSLISNPMGFLFNVAAIVFVFGVIIFVHEFGHFIVAKRLGVRVEQFSFGFGREIFGFQWGETRYTVNWIPLGGYVRMAGEMPEDYAGPKFEGASTSAQERDKSRDFLGKPWYARIGIALAGPAMNYILAAVLFFSMFMIWGESIQTNPTEIGGVIDGRPAAVAGLQPGDRILSVDGFPTEHFMDVRSTIRKKPAESIELEVKRDETILTFSMIAEKDEDQGGVGIVGIWPAVPVIEHKSVGVFEGGRKAIHQCWRITKFTLGYLGNSIRYREKPDVAGPVGITQVIVKAVHAGPENFIFLIAMISLAIGLFNLFPIPMLDGSHVVYYLIEGIRGRPLSTGLMNKISVVGVVLLLSLMVFATMNDIQRIASEKPKVVEEPKR